MFRNFAASVATLCLIAGCGSSREDLTFAPQGAQQTAPPTANFFVQGPPVTGQVAIKDAGGRILAQGPASGGLATLSVPTGISPMFVTFTVDEGEHLDAGDAPATFSAEVTSLENGAVVGLDPVTSLIALYHREHADLTLEQASQEVFEFLQLPADTEIDHYFDDTAFESELFYDEAEVSGGVDQLLDKMVDDVAGTQTSEGRFLKANVVLTGVFDKLAEKLAESALDYAVGQAKTRVTGWLEGLIGLGEPSIADVLSSLENLRADVERLSNQIANQANVQAYNDMDRVLIKERSNADEDTTTLTGWASPTNLTPPSEAQISARMEQIRTRYNSTLTTAAKLELPEVGSNGVLKPGLAGLYLNAAAPRLYGAANKEIATYHLRQSLGFQQLVLNLLVESLHYARPSLLLDAERAIDTYFANAKSQKQQYPLPFDEENLILDRGTNLLWSRKPIVVNDHKRIGPLLKDYTLGDSPRGVWRLPTSDEFATLVSATGGTGYDQHTEVGMLKAGFLPINGASQVGDWRIAGPWNWYALCAPITRQSGEASNYLGNLTHVSNFRRRVERVENYGRVDPVVFYVIREMPTVVSLEVKETNRNPYLASYQATAKLSDGSSRDLTNLVRWSVTRSDGTAVTQDVARISNIPSSDGLLTLRVANTSLIVKASYNNVEAQTQAPTLGLTPSVIGLLISPVRYRVPTESYNASNTVQVAFHVRTVRRNGALADADSNVTWTSSDPSATISASGLVTATRPARSKTINITATQDGITQTSRLVLDP